MEGTKIKGSPLTRVVNFDQTSKVSRVQALRAERVVRMGDEIKSGATAWRRSDPTQAKGDEKTRG
jgi:hypothetical protein